MRLKVEITGTGPPVVLLHGWGLHSGIFSGVRAALNSNWRVHSIDLPGHGRSPWLDSIVDLPGLARQVLPHVPSGAAVLGWSLGGMTALSLARLAPRCIDRLVLVATTPRFVAAGDWPHGMSARLLAAFAQRLRVDYRRTVNEFLALQVRGEEHELETLRALRARLLNQGVPRIEALTAGLEILRRSDLRRELSRIALPTLVIAGEYDRITPPAAARYLAEQLPAARFRLIERAGHAPFLSHHAEFLSELEPFLAPGRSPASVESLA